MSTDTVLAGFVTGVITADGTYTSIRFGPTQFGVSWDITRFSCSASQKCVLAIYRDYVSPTTQINYTTKGIGDTSTQDDVQMQVGQVLIAQWTGGTAGDTVTLSYEGTMSQQGDRGFGGK